jgi:peptidylprolyl isomerase
MITPVRVAIVAAILGIGTAVLIVWMQPQPPPETGYTEAPPPPPPTSQPALPLAAGQRISMPSGLTYIDVKVGTGPAVKIGDHVAVNYVGRLYYGGETFDDSAKRGVPLKFQAGEGQLIRGFDQGVLGMQVGGKRELLIPADLGYGSNGAGTTIPPDAPLVFDVELVAIEH